MYMYNVQTINVLLDEIHNKKSIHISPETTDQPEQ